MEPRKVYGYISRRFIATDEPPAIFWEEEDSLKDRQETGSYYTRLPDFVADLINIVEYEKPPHEHVFDGGMLRVQDGERFLVCAGCHQLVKVEIKPKENECNNKATQSVILLNHADKSSV